MDIDKYLDWFYQKFNKPFMPQWTCYRQDHTVLLTLIQENNIKSIFEIGTWSGWTTLLMWLFPGVEKIHSLDIHAGLNVEYAVANHLLMPKHFYGHYYKDTPVELEFCDSMQRTTLPGEKYDMVFIDGNHDYKHVKSDTELGLTLATKVIAWHDYGSEPGVNTYLNEIGNFQRNDNCLVAYRILDIDTKPIFQEENNE